MTNEEMLRRMPEIYRAAAKRVAEKDFGDLEACCYAIYRASSPSNEWIELDRYAKDAFAKVFKPRHKASGDYWFGHTTIENAGAREIALLLMAEMAEDAIKELK